MDEFSKKRKGFSLGESEKDRRNNLIIIFLTVLLAIVAVIFIKQHNENKKILLVLNQEKTAIQTDLNTMVANYDSIHTTNENLKVEMEGERTKVKDLLLEVKQVKKIGRAHV